MGTTLYLFITNFFDRRFNCRGATILGNWLGQHCVFFSQKTLLQGQETGREARAPAIYSRRRRAKKNRGPPPESGRSLSLANVQQFAVPQVKKNKKNKKKLFCPHSCDLWAENFHLRVKITRANTPASIGRISRFFRELHARFSQQILNSAQHPE